MASSASDRVRLGEPLPRVPAVPGPRQRAAAHRAAQLVIIGPGYEHLDGRDEPPLPGGDIRASRSELGPIRHLRFGRSTSQPS